MSNSQSLTANSNRSAKLKPVYENSLVFLSYALLTVAMTYPAVLFLRSRLIGGPEDNFHFLWELWYVAHALFDLHKSPFFDPDVFVPFGFSLIRNQDLSPGTVLLFSPITHFSGEVFTYNFLVLASFPLTAFGAYLLAREMWSNRLAALLAGVAIGFCPYRFAHAAGHLSIVSTEWIPFFFLYLERVISKPRLKNAVLAGVFFGLSAWATWYYFFMIPIAAVFYVGFRIDWKTPSQYRRRLFRLSLVSVGVALVFILPFLIPVLLATRGQAIDYRGAGESQTFAAALADYVIPPAAHVWWGRMVTALWRSGPNGVWLSEWELYVGAPAMLLAAIGLFHRRRRVVVALSALAISCLLFSFGPGIYLTHPPPLGAEVNDVALSPIPAPGRLLRQLPGFNNLRAWARLGFFVEFSVGLLAAAGLARILEWMKERFHLGAVVRAGVALGFTGLAILDFRQNPLPMSTVAPRAVDEWLSKKPGEFAIMEYPIPRHAYGGPAMYSTRLNGKKIIMGNAQNPPNVRFWSDLSAFPSPSTLDLLYGWGAKYVLVDENLYRAGISFWNIYQTWDTLRAAIEASPRLKEVAVVDGVHVYQIGSVTQQANPELLANGGFEGGSRTFVSGWQIVGKPTIDRTGMYSSSGTAACAVTAKDYLLSAPVLVEPDRCYRFSVHQKASSAKLGTLLLQLDWQDGNNRDLHIPTITPVQVHSAQQWQVSYIIARAPAASKYAVARAQTADGKVWVDDYSLRKIPDDCQPELFVTPNAVSVLPGQVGRAAVSWNMCCNSEGRITLAVNNGTESSFADGQSGLKFLEGIKPGTHYQFRLYTEQQAAPVESVELNAVTRAARIVAEPNPVPAGSGLGRTRISWATLEGGDAEVRVSRDGAPEQLFARGATGSIEVGWIVTGSNYEFRLYSLGGERQLVAKTIVRR